MLVAAGRAHGAEPDTLLPGRVVVLRTGAQLRVVATAPKGASFAMPAAANDPAVAGGALDVFAVGAGAPMTFALAPPGWRGLGNPAGSRGWAYKGAGTIADPCSLRVTPSSVRIACRGAALTLAPPLAGDLGVVLSLGTDPKRYCATFGGTTTANEPGRLTRKNAPAAASCASSTPPTPTPTPLPDVDHDGVPDALDRCPGGDDRIDGDRDGTPDACEESAVRSVIDDFESYASDAALRSTWSAWPEGGDATVTRGVAQGEGGSTAMTLVPVGADPVTGSTWASVSRALAGPADAAFEGIVWFVEHSGAKPLALGLNLTESGGETWAPGAGAVSLLPAGGAWTSGLAADANGVVTLPAGFTGLVRVRFASLAIPAWYAGPGNGVFEEAALSRVSLGFDVTGRTGEIVHVDSLTWWYGVDPGIAGKIASRDFPSIYQPWSGIDDEPGVDLRTLVARHDLLWRTPGGYGLFYDAGALLEPCTPDPGGSCLALATGFTAASRASAAAIVADLRARNPNLVLILEVRYREQQDTQLPASHRFWQRDAQGNRVAGWSEGTYVSYLLDWHDSEVRALVAQQARAAVAAGLDGVFLDWWDDNDDDRLALARAVRDAIGDRLLIVNNNDRPLPRSAQWINGSYMEGYRSATVADWQGLATTLRSNEALLRRPRLSPIETWYASSRLDLDRMRATTTLSLTQSDGYALFCDPNGLPTPDHLHSWYALWNEPLGRPVAPGAQQADGSWRREFTGGTVVYNPMGNAPVQVSFGGARRSAATGLVATTHTVPARDGDIFIPAP